MILLDFIHSSFQLLFPFQWLSDIRRLSWLFPSFRLLASLALLSSTSDLTCPSSRLTLLLLPVFLTSGTVTSIHPGTWTWNPGLTILVTPQPLLFSSLTYKVIQVLTFSPWLFPEPTVSPPSLPPLSSVTLSSPLGHYSGLLLVCLVSSPFARVSSLPAARETYMKYRPCVTLLLKVLPTHSPCRKIRIPKGPSGFLGWHCLILQSCLPLSPASLFLLHHWTGNGIPNTSCCFISRTWFPLSRVPLLSFNLAVPPRPSRLQGLRPPGRAFSDPVGSPPVCLTPQEHAPVS